MIQGVLFDMDGVLLDTEKLYTRFWQEAARYYGYPMTREQALAMRSLNRATGEAKMKSFFGPQLDYATIRNKRIALMDAYIEAEGVEAKPGAAELITFLKEKGIPCAIATSSPLERTQDYLRSVGLENRFDAIVSGYMVEKGKPEPDIFLYAAQQIKVAPEHCLVLEDSPSGILAAYRAGCFPVMVPDQDEPDEETKSRLFALCPDLYHVMDLFL